MDNIEEDDGDEEDEEYAQSFYVIDANKPHDSAYVNYNVKVPRLKGIHKLRLKIDTGVSSYTLPIRTYRQMCGSDDSMIKPVKVVKLTAYNGQRIICLGQLKLKCQYKSNWLEANFYVVDVDSPAIISLKVQ